MMKKTVHKVLSFLFAAVFVLLLIPSPSAQAVWHSQDIESGNVARIRYAANGRYLDVPAEALYDNGTQLQLWDYAYGNQNQLFSFVDTGNGWKIISHASNKVVEVRNSSHEDFAQVAQWDIHDLACARWDIVPYSDGSVAFRNRESGLYLNVLGGGDAGNGTKIIQYHDDGTIAMHFFLEIMSYSDVLSATFSRNLQSYELQWTAYAPFFDYTQNHTGWELQDNGWYYHPTVNQPRVFMTAEYLSPNIVANMLKERAYTPTLKRQIESAVKGELTESAVAALLSSLGFKNIPGLGVAIGILNVLATKDQTDRWNRFVDATRIDPYGRHAGVIIYTYYDIRESAQWGPLNNGTTAWGNHYHIRKVAHTEYGSWTGDNFGDVCTLPVNVASGHWYYTFK